jgi:hypothetical protein
LECASEGIHSGNDSVFFLKRDSVVQRALESPPVYVLAKGKDIHRYDAVNAESLDNVVIYPYDLATGDVLSAQQLQTIAPNTWRYLNERREDLSGRPYFDRSRKVWYELWCQRASRLYTLPKIIGPEIAARGEFTYSTEVLFFNNKLKGLILKEGVRERIEYVLGLLNSSLLVNLHKSIAPPKGGGFFEVEDENHGPFANT